MKDTVQNYLSRREFLRLSCFGAAAYLTGCRTENPVSVQSSSADNTLQAVSKSEKTPRNLELARAIHSISWKDIFAGNEEKLQTVLVQLDRIYRDETKDVDTPPSSIILCNTQAEYKQALEKISPDSYSKWKSYSGVAFYNSKQIVINLPLLYRDGISYQPPLSAGMALCDLIVHEFTHLHRKENAQGELLNREWMTSSENKKWIKYRGGQVVLEDDSIALTFLEEAWVETINRLFFEKIFSDDSGNTHIANRILDEDIYAGAAKKLRILTDATHLTLGDLSDMHRNSQFEQLAEKIGALFNDELLQDQVILKANLELHDGNTVPLPHQGLTNMIKGRLVFGVIHNCGKRYIQNDDTPWDLLMQYYTQTTP